MSDETKLRMNAYYFSFDETGAHSIDRVLSAVACAGKAFHSTESWTEECSPYHPEMRGDSAREWIQNAATDAAAELAAMKAQRDEAVRLLKSARSGLMTATEDDEMWNEQALSVCGRIDRLLSEVTP